MVGMAATEATAITGTTVVIMATVIITIITGIIITAIAITSTFITAAGNGAPRPGQRLPPLLFETKKRNSSGSRGSGEFLDSMMTTAIGPPAPPAPMPRPGQRAGSALGPFTGRRPIMT